MSQIHDGISAGSFVEDGTAGSYIMDLVSVDVPPVVPETIPPQILGQSQDSFSGITGINHAWGVSKAWAYFHISLGGKEFPYTFDWNQFLDNEIFARQNRPFQLSKAWAYGATPDPMWESFPFNRRWAGLGGLVYIPSFPQLSRNETTWPHAT